MIVRDLMLKEVVTAPENFSVREVIDLIFKRHVGCMMIVNDEHKCVGIFTERDAIRVVAQNIPLEAPISKVMTKNPFAIKEDQTFEEAKEIFKSQGIRHLPVSNEEGKLVGMLSVRYILAQICGL
jgi:CBS domain-containing protein